MPPPGPWIFLESPSPRFLQSAESEAVMFLNENTVQLILHETLQRSVPREPDSRGREPWGFTALSLNTQM